MKKTTRILSLLLSLVMLLSVLTLAVACDSTEKETESESGSQSESETTTGTEAVTDGKIDYTVSITTIGGRPIPQIPFYIYVGDDLITYGQTGEDGTGTVSLEGGKDYTVQISESSLKGYDLKEKYEFVKEVLWQEDGKFVGLDHEIPLGSNGKALGK